MSLSLDDLKKRYPKRVKDIEILNIKYLEEEKEIKKLLIIEEIERYEEHLELTRSISSCFSKHTEIAAETGYIFQFTEPLLDYGVKNFDVLISNERTSFIFIVECKTITGKVTEAKVKRILKETKDRREVLVDRLDELSRQIGHSIDPDGIEIVLLLDDIHVEDFVKGYEHAEGNLKQDIIVMSYDSMGDCLSLAEGFRLKDEALNGYLSDGIDLIYHKKPFFNIPCLIQDAQFNVFQSILIDQTKRNDSSIKEFSEFDIRDGLKKIPIGASNVRRREMIEEKADELIKHLLKYNMIERKGESNEKFRILCQGEKRHVIRDKFRKKYIRNRSLKMAKERALERVENEIGKSSSLDKWCN